MIRGSYRLALASPETISSQHAEKALPSTCHLV
jgi:hypothetical protein